MLTYTGFLKVKNDEVKISDKFKKREFVLTDNAASYPQTILFQLTQDRCSLLDPFQQNDEIRVHFLLKGREWKNPKGEIKFFNSLDVFRIEKVGQGGAAESETTFSNEAFVPTPDDDLPF